MKILRFSKLCLAVMLVLGFAVAWSAAMPNQMGKKRLALVGGLECCMYKVIREDYTNCSAYGDCTGTHTFAYGEDLTSVRTYNTINGDKCSGDDSMCNWITSTVKTSECANN